MLNTKKIICWSKYMLSKPERNMKFNATSASPSGRVILSTIHNHTVSDSGDITVAGLFRELF